MKIVLPATATLLAVLLTACSPGATPDPSSQPAAADPVPSDSASPDPGPEEEPAFTFELPVGRSNVRFDQNLSLDVSGAEKVKIVGERVGERGETEDPTVTLPGTLEGTVWTASSYMEPSTRYTVRVWPTGASTPTTESFTTRKVPLAKQTYPTLFPSGGTYGVGQPVIVRFDVPVTDRASIERHLEVKTVPEQAGSWRWISPNEVRYRPKTYWKPNTRVEVSANVNSVAAGDGVWGQFDRAARFRVAPVAKVLRVNLATKQLQAFENGKLVRTIPISAGKPGFTTRSGTKVIMSKHRYYDMNSSSIGIDPNSSEGYDLSNVEYAMRITNSGEFIHASPWNNGLHGVANLSHGCTGATIADTGWIFNWAPVGTPVEYRGSDYMMTVDNGWGDWTLKYKDYKDGSAL